MSLTNITQYFDRNSKKRDLSGNSNQKGLDSLSGQIEKQDQYPRCNCLLDPRRQLEGAYEIGSVCPSVRPSVCLGVFLESYHQFLLNFGVTLETHMNLCVTAGFSINFFCPILGKWAKNRVFFNILKNFVLIFTEFVR